MLRQFELVERVKSYDPDADEEALDRAYVYAVKAHGEQKRESGDPYYFHSVEVAGILTEYKLDAATIITALLHDTVEDTKTTPADIKDLFGEEIARLVDGVTKLSKIHLKTTSHSPFYEAENFRKLVLAVSDDIRVLFVKLADLLHNMRTIRFKKSPERRQAISREVIDIYTPLAERIGLYAIKNELENLAFRELQPEAAKSIESRLSYLREHSENLIDQIIIQLKKDLKEAKIPVRIFGREKTPFSIWRKMMRKNVIFEQLSDVMAFRVIVPSLSDCYAALGQLHTKYPMVPGRYKDYISTPKPNGYKSIHTDIIGPSNKRIEVQIRTEEMHQVDEMGIAAHWIYKQGNIQEGRKFHFIRELLSILETASDSEEFLANTKLEMYRDQVFCFTPKGDLISLPKNATPVDFAYALHSDIGHRCVGAKINGVIKPLRTLLENGDQVEILTSKVQKPSPDWENFVVTGKARSAIARFIREQKQEQYYQLGKQILERAYKSEGFEYSEKSLDAILKKFSSNTTADLVAHVGEGTYTPKQILEAVFPGLKTKFSKVVKSFTQKKKKKKEESPDSMPIRGISPGIVIHYGKCCHPLPGDRIVGIITTGKGIMIHNVSCHTLQRYADEPERWMDLAWNDKTDHSDLTGRIKLIAVNDSKTIPTLMELFARHNAVATNLRILNRSAGFIDMIIDLELQSLEQLYDIMSALRALPSVNSVVRWGE